MEYTQFGEIIPSKHYLEQKTSFDKIQDKKNPIISIAKQTIPNEISLENPNQPLTHAISTKDGQMSKEKSQKAVKVDKFLEIFQLFISDVVLKVGGKSAFPMVFPSKKNPVDIEHEESEEENDFLKDGSGILKEKTPLPSVESIDTAKSALAEEIYSKGISVLDTGVGAVALIYKKRILSLAKKEIENLRRLKNLSETQIEKLERLDALVDYQLSSLPTNLGEQSVRAGRNLLSFLSTGVKEIDKFKGVSLFAGSVEPLLWGFKTVLNAFWLYQANKNIKNQAEVVNRLEEFKEKFSVKFIPESNEKINDKNVKDFLSKRYERKKKMLESLKEDKNIEKNQKAKNWVFENYFNKKLNTLQQLPSVTEVKEALKVNFGIDGPQEWIGEFLQKLEKANHLAIEKLQLGTETKETLLLKIKQELFSEFSSKLNEMGGDEGRILQKYVDYHDVLDQTIKNSLIQMIENKHTIEKNILKMKRITDAIRFAVSFICTGVLIGLTIAAFISNPIGAAALIFLLMTLASAGVSVGCVVATYVREHGLKPNSTFAFIFQKLQIFKLAFLTHAEQLTTQIAKEQLFYNPNEKERSIKKETSEMPQTIEELKSMEEKKEKAKRTELALSDFSKNAQLQSDNSFNTLEAFSEALSQCNFDSLSDETKELFNDHIGISVKSLEVEFKKDPAAIKNLLKNFFSMDVIEYMNFIGQQKKMFENKNINK